jgi:predicted transcriptional regulator
MEDMRNHIVAATAHIVRTKVEHSPTKLTEDELASTIRKVGDALKQVAGEDPVRKDEAEQQPAADVKNSIREKSVVCLECGKQFKILTKRHLAQHGLTPQEYKEKWGYKKSSSLVAKSLARERRKKMKEMELWKRRQAA